MLSRDEASNTMNNNLPTAVMVEDPPVISIAEAMVEAEVIGILSFENIIDQIANLQNSIVIARSSELVPFNLEALESQLSEINAQTDMLVLTSTQGLQIVARFQQIKQILDERLNESETELPELETRLSSLNQYQGAMFSTAPRSAMVITENGQAQIRGASSVIVITEEGRVMDIIPALRS